jgi:hypothetical protein
MKVAQHFSAGLAFFNAFVPAGTIEFGCHTPNKVPNAIIQSSLSGRIVFSDSNPAPKAFGSRHWLTNEWSLALD